jgi:hypothetical protein
MKSFFNKSKKKIQQGTEKIANVASKTQQVLGWDEATCNKNKPSYINPPYFCQKNLTGTKYIWVQTGNKQACEKNISSDLYCKKESDSKYYRKPYYNYDDCIQNKNDENKCCVYNNVAGTLVAIPCKEKCNMKYKFKDLDTCNQCTNGWCTKNPDAKFDRDKVYLVKKDHPFKGYHKTKELCNTNIKKTETCVKYPDYDLWYRLPTSEFVTKENCEEKIKHCIDHGNKQKIQDFTCPYKCIIFDNETNKYYPSKQQTFHVSKAYIKNKNEEEEAQKKKRKKSGGGGQNMLNQAARAGLF